MNKHARRSRRNLVPAALLGAALVTAGGSAVVPAGAAQAAAADRVVVSAVSATERPTTLGTRVQVSYTLTNGKASQTAPRRVKLLLVDGDNQRRFGVASVPALKPGAIRTFTTTRLVGPRFVEGDYDTRVCYTRIPGASCATTAGRTVTIAPARITPDADVVAVPLGDGETQASPRRVVVTNTGQARTGPIALSLENPALPDAAQEGAVPSTDFAIDSTTCTGLVPGAQCTIDIARTPESSPTATGRLVIAGARGAVGQVILTSPVRIEPGAHDFGDVAVGSSASKILTLINDSDQTINVPFGTAGDSPAFYFDFYADGSFTCDDGVPLPPGGSCTVTVRFDPQSAGSFEAGGTLFTSVGAAPFQLSGTGTPGEGPAPRRAGSSTFGVTN